jgi:hypothetical protein
MKLRLDYLKQEEISNMYRKQMNEPAIEQTYEMIFEDKGFETKLISYRDTILKVILGNEFLFNMVPIACSSPVIELAEF